MLTDWLNDFCGKLFDVCVFLCCCAEGRFHTVLVHCSLCFGIILITFWYHFGDVLVSFWHPWGVIWRPWALPEDPRRGRCEKITKKSIFGRLLVAQSGAFGEPFWMIFVFLAMFFQVIFPTRFSEGFWCLWGPPPTMKMVVSPRRNHCFHISTCTPKSDRKWAPMGTLWHPLGTKMQKKEVQKTCKKRVSKKV